jgi:ATP-dependent DNA ligase
MEALLVAEIPSEKGWQYEPKWDGFHRLAFVEVQYDHFTGNRFKHGTKFLRWRPDKSPKAYSMAQSLRRKF